MHVDHTLLLVDGIDHPAIFGVKVAMVADIAHQLDVFQFDIEEKGIGKAQVRGVFLQPQTEVAALIRIAGHKVFMVFLPCHLAVELLECIVYAELVAVLGTGIEAYHRVVVSAPQREKHKGYDKQYSPKGDDHQQVCHTLIANLTKKNDMQGI